MLPVGAQVMGILGVLGAEKMDIGVNDWNMHGLPPDLY